MPLFLFFPSFPFYREISKKGRTYPVVMQNALCIPAHRHIMRFSDTKRSAEEFAKYGIHLIEARPFSHKNIVCHTCCLVWRSTREVIDLHDNLHIDEVAQQLAIAVDRRRLIAQKALDELRNDRCVCAGSYPAAVHRHRSSAFHSSKAHNSAYTDRHTPHQRISSLRMSRVDVRRSPPASASSHRRHRRLRLRHRSSSLRHALPPPSRSPCR